MTPLRSLLRDDGSVVVPAVLAGEVLRYLGQAITGEARTTGAMPTRAARQLLHALHEAAQQAADGPGSVDGTTTPPPSIVEVTVEEASSVMGCSTRWVRRLAGGGHLRARRVGRAWLIDAASLDAYRHGRTAA